MKLTQVILFTLITISFISCSKKKQRNQDFLPPLEIKVPVILTGDPEVFDFIISSENDVNKFSDNIEMITIEGKETINGNLDSLSIIDGLTIAKIMLDFYSNSTKLQNTINEFDKYMYDLKYSNSINEEQFKEMKIISQNYKDRVTTLEHKYTEYYKR